MADRKKSHINLALKAQTLGSELDDRFEYEPLLSEHPTEFLKPFDFLGKTFKVPIWVSSMTGGTKHAEKINNNLARVCKHFGMGMGLGSCRTLLNDLTHLKQFDLRDVIGDDQPFYANLGICQVEALQTEGKTQKVHDLINLLRADGLIIHVNPLQEWLQDEGDRLTRPPIETIKRILNEATYKVIIKEVGQGMGKESLHELLQLPIEAIEFAAYGGTNFARLEMQRSKEFQHRAQEAFSRVGLTAETMLEYVNREVDKTNLLSCRQIIISGGIQSFLDGYYLISKSKLPAIYGQASAFLTYARDSYEALFGYVESQVKALRMAEAYLKVKE